MDVKEPEIWKPIKGYEGYYEVSDLGRVRGLERYVNGYKIKPKIMSLWLSKGGYCRVCLNKEGVQTPISLHRLVASTFIPNPENKACVNHIDGNPSNNKLSNLEWATYRENTTHYIEQLRK